MTPRSTLHQNEHPSDEGGAPVAKPGPRARRRSGMAIAALALLGLTLTLRAGWIGAKATLAQVLLQRAWGQARAGMQQPRPWPWADTWAVAKLGSNLHQREYVVLEGASGEATAFAPAHLRGSAPPGKKGNIAIAAHRDTHFDFLQRLQPGDRLWLESLDGARHQYRVRSARVVDRSDTSALESLRDQLTLITCYPFDAKLPGGRLRYVVEADRIQAS